MRYSRGDWIVSDGIRVVVVVVAVCDSCDRGDRKPVSSSS